MGVCHFQSLFSFVSQEKANLTDKLTQLNWIDWALSLELPWIYLGNTSKRTRWKCGSSVGVCDWVQMGVTQWELIGPQAPTIVRAAPSSSTGSSIWSWIDCPPRWLATIAHHQDCRLAHHDGLMGGWCHAGFLLNQKAIISLMPGNRKIWICIITWPEVSE